jgi:hypothetical protein
MTRYFFPSIGITVEAVTLEEAIAIAKGKNEPAKKKPVKSFPSK